MNFVESVSNSHVEPYGLRWFTNPDEQADWVPAPLTVLDRFYIPPGLDLIHGDRVVLNMMGRKWTLCERRIQERDCPH